jgi:hypothetical protein
VRLATTAFWVDRLILFIVVKIQLYDNEPKFNYLLDNIEAILSTSALRLFEFVFPLIGAIKSLFLVINIWGQTNSNHFVPPIDGIASNSSMGSSSIVRNNFGSCHSLPLHLGRPMDFVHSCENSTSSYWTKIYLPCR